MGTEKGRAKFPARISVQMSGELKTRLSELARREYGGDLQALLRETLRERVDGRGAPMDHVQGALQALDRAGKDIIRQHRDLQDVVHQLLLQAGRLADTVSAQHAETNDAIAGLTEHVANQSDAIARLTERTNGPPARRRNLLGL